MNSMNTELARFNMIEQQIRTQRVLDETLIDLLSVIPREQFLPPQLQSLAFADTMLPIDEGQLMLSPTVQARMIQDLNIQKHESVLEIGCGTGYTTALLAHCARTVEAIDIFPSLVRAARHNLQRTTTLNARVSVANGAQYSSHTSCDVIILSGAVHRIPDQLLQLLHTGGRLFAIVGEDPVMRATIVTRNSPTDFSTVQPWDTIAPQLLHFAQEEAFNW